MKRKSIKLLICLMLVVLSILTFSLVACDKPAGVDGPNVNNNLIIDDSEDEDEGLEKYINKNSEFINKQLNLAGLDGYTANVVTKENLDILNKALDSEYKASDNSSVNQLAIKRINTKKKNVENIFINKDPEIIVYTKKIDKKVDYKIEYGLAYVPYDLYNVYCELYLALTDADYLANKDKLIKELQTEINDSVDLMGKMVINRNSNKLLTNLYEQYVFFDMIDGDNGFQKIKGTKTLLKYTGTQKDVVVPKDINRIAPEAFKNNQYISSITLDAAIIPQGNIGQEAFSGIGGLTINYKGISSWDLHEETFKSNEIIKIKTDGVSSNRYMNGDASPMYSILYETINTYDPNEGYNVEYAPSEDIDKALDRKGYRNVCLRLVDYIHKDNMIDYINSYALTQKWDKEKTKRVINNFNYIPLTYGEAFAVMVDKNTLNTVGIFTDLMYIDSNNAFLIENLFKYPEEDYNNLSKEFINKRTESHKYDYNIHNYRLNINNPDNILTTLEFAKITQSLNRKNIYRNNSMQDGLLGYAEYCNVYNDEGMSINILANAVVNDKNIKSNKGLFGYDEKIIIGEGAFNNWKEFEMFYSGKDILLTKNMFANGKDVAVVSEANIEFAVEDNLVPSNNKNKLLVFNYVQKDFNKSTLKAFDRTGLIQVPTTSKDPMYDQYEFLGLIEEDTNRFAFVKDTNILLGYNGNETEISIPSRTECIRNRAFAYKNQLKLVNVNFGIIDMNKIGEEIFYGINDLKVIYSGMSNSISSYPLWNSNAVIMSQRKSEKQFYLHNMPFEKSVENYLYEENAKRLNQLYTSIITGNNKIAIADATHLDLINDYIKDISKTKQYTLLQSEQIKNNVKKILDSGIQILLVVNEQCKVVEVLSDIPYYKNKMDCRVFAYALNQVFDNPDLDLNSDSLKMEAELETANYYNVNGFFVSLESNKNFNSLFDKLNFIGDYKHNQNIKSKTYSDRSYGTYSELGGVYYFDKAKASFGNNQYSLFIKFNVSDPSVTDMNDFELYFDRYIIYAKGVFKNWESLDTVHLQQGSILEGDLFAGTKDVLIKLDSSATLPTNNNWYNNSDKRVFVLFDGERTKGINIYNQNGLQDNLQPSPTDLFNYVRSNFNNFLSSSGDSLSQSGSYTNEKIRAFDFGDWVTLRNGNSSNVNYNIVNNYVRGYDEDVILTKLRYSESSSGLVREFYVGYSNNGGEVALKSYLQINDKKNLDTVMSQHELYSVYGNYVFIYCDTTGIMTSSKLSSDKELYLSGQYV